MGYFPNGTAGLMYEEQYCYHCQNYGPEEGPGCAVWLAHLLRNYEDCNDEKSILHILIPRTKDGLGNEQCLMFHPTQKSPDDNFVVADWIRELNDEDPR